MKKYMKKIIDIDSESKGAIKIMAIIAAFLWIATNTCVQAQEKGVSFNVQGNLVSSYVWRGMYQSGAAIQPTLGLSAGGFSLTAWGSVDFTGQGHKEADLTAAYSVKGFTISLADYWWAGQAGSNTSGEKANADVDGAGRNKYFNFDNHDTKHILEAGLAYTLPIEKFPLSIAWYTMFWGGDKKANDKGEVKNAYSSYIELNYPFTVKTVDLNTTLGASPFKSPGNYYNDGFAVTNVGLKATKAIRFTDNFSLPVFAQAIWSPSREDVHFVFGITLKP